MENKIVVGNMKMNLTLDEVKEYIISLDNYKDCIICPSYIYIPYFIDAGYKVGTQDISEYGIGSYTGEVSVNQILSMGVNYTIVGHSERRENFNESDELVNKKLRMAISNNVKTILCIGETNEERVMGNTKEKIEKQLTLDLQNIEEDYYDNIIIAYEPIWAIGTGKIPSNEDIKEIVSFIKNIIYNKYGFTPIVLYGGSTNEKNILELNKIDIVDGFLVGGACLDPDKFKKIIETIR